MRVLIVEDEGQCGEFLAELLTLWGYDVQRARDAIEALEKIPIFQPAVGTFQAQLCLLWNATLAVLQVCPQFFEIQRRLHKVQRAYPFAPKTDGIRSMGAWSSA